MRLRNRVDAGRQLGARLAEYAGRTDVVVLALPRGGVPVASEVAASLKAPLDVFLVRKLGVPGHAELAMGAIAEGGVEVLSPDLIRDLSIPHAVPVRIPLTRRALEGDLVVPDGAVAIVLFAHGSGSSRHSPRNQFVAAALQRRGLATLLIDLLTPEEESIDVQSGEYRFDIPMLSARLVTVVDWIRKRQDAASLPIGLFGASTGGAAAIMAAAARPEEVSAVVSRGGRPDLAGRALSTVSAPTLLIVGGLDTPVISMNRDAMKVMGGEVKLEIVPGATHLFEEGGTLERVAELAGDWFLRCLRRRQ